MSARGFDHPTQSSAEVMNEESYASILSSVPVMGSYRVTFTFTAWMLSWDRIQRKGYYYKISPLTCRTSEKNRGSDLVDNGPQTVLVHVSLKTPFQKIFILKSHNHSINGVGICVTGRCKFMVSKNGPGNPKATFYLCVLLQHDVCSNNSCTEVDLKLSIQNEKIFN
jgi:hypothetical protein